VIEAGADAASNDYVGELWILAGIGLTAVLGWIGGIIAKKMREPVRIESLWTRLDEQDKRIESLGKRLDASEQRDAAKGRIIRALARQWPGGNVPRLNPDDIAELEEDTLPDH
jgi:hypothetical protein